MRKESCTYCRKLIVHQLGVKTFRESLPGLTEEETHALLNPESPWDKRMEIGKKLGIVSVDQLDQLIRSLTTTSLDC